MCKHDPLYRIDNEAAGGAGCPICNAQRTKRVMVSDSHDQRYDAEWFRSQVIDARLAQPAPDVDLLDMRETTGKWVLPDDEVTAMRRAAQRGIDSGGFMGHED